jgi:hypothetical protein
MGSASDVRLFGWLGLVAARVVVREGEKESHPPHLTMRVHCVGGWLLDGKLKYDRRVGARVPSMRNIEFMRPPLCTDRLAYLRWQTEPSEKWLPRPRHEN